MKSLLQQIESKCRVSIELKDALSTAFEKVEFKAGENLADGNSVMRYLYFVESGTVRTYYFHDGKDITSWFYIEDSFFTSWYSFLQQDQVSEPIEVLQDTIAYRISRSDLYRLYSEFPEFNDFGRKLMEEQVAFLDYYFKGHSFISAKEKYDLLLAFYPDITQRIKLGHIASFLGISQETLSRIRAQK